jgi:exodeoxyribonuclease V alpha subunit
MPKRTSPSIESSLSAGGAFSDIDIHFARFIARFDPQADSDIFLAAALASRATGSGDICLDLAGAADTAVFEKNDGTDAVVCPPLDDWRKKLIASPTVGQPGERCPLILDARDRLYLYRYWEYESRLSHALRQRAAGELEDFNPGDLSNILKKLFPPTSTDEVNWQAVATVIALFKRFCVISGGPGSGKTFTIAGILVLLLECAFKSNARIFLAAPTGKAAARLAESIQEAKQSLDCRESIKNAIPDEVHTVHRLLRPIPRTPYFRHNSENPLAADLVVVDEASMVDLALISKLVQALAPETRLVLVGDKDQLASVEPGSVLGDICNRQIIHGFSKRFSEKIEQIIQVKLNDTGQYSTHTSGLQDCITVLQKNYRFKPQSGIGGLSRSVNRGDSRTALSFLNDPAEKSISRHDFHTDSNWVGDLSQRIVEGYIKYLTIDDCVLAMREFMRFKILCALNIGPFGVNSINRLAEKVLSEQGLLASVPPGRGQWYRGRPVLITQNDYNLGLFNGDIGITLPDPNSASDELFVYFPGATGKFKRYPTHRLSKCETVYAMTVHKSQGSEFEHVILLLPEKDYPLLTRELIYTGLTRARKTVSVWGSESILKTAIARRIKRTAGLRDALWA